jgi:DNA-binding MarR family transcriptional regulator
VSGDGDLLDRPLPAVPNELDPLELGAWRGLLRVHAALVRALDADLMRDHGLPLSTYDVLVNLAVTPGGRMRMHDLADAILLSRSGLTRLVDRLCRDGLLAREACPDDARGSFAVLTEAGIATLAAARPDHLAAVRRRFHEHLDRDALEALADAWEHVLPGSAQP